MASTTAQTAVSTPTRTPIKAPGTPTTESPGTWRHPRIQEITKRQKASTITEKNINPIMINLALILALFLLQSYIQKALPPKRSAPHIWTYFKYTRYVVFVVPVLNIVLNLLPLFRPKDDFSDIPLTPGQRKLLGLPRSSAPPTPGSVYSTPPRYTRTPSASGSVGSRRSFSSSPILTRSPSSQDSPTPGGNGSGITSPGHHLLQKAMFGARRSSLGSIGSPSPIRGSTSTGAALFGSGPETPSPSPARKRSTVGLNSKWRYDRGMYERATVSSGGFLNGFDTGSIGAITSMPQFIDSLGKLSPSLLGFVVSVILLTGAVPSVFAGHLADKYGRLTVIFPGAILFGIGALVQGTASSQSQLIIGRGIGGLGEGTFFSIISTYICEIAPVRHRGTLAGLPQFMSVTGIASGYFTCYGSVYIKSSFAWRLPFIVQVFISVLLAWCCFVLPESPRWLQMQGKREETLRAFERLEISMVEAQRIMIVPATQNLSLSPWRSLLLLFRKTYRSRTILALFILGMVQLSGIDAILYYAPILFKQAGLSSENASFLASGVSGILMLAISIPGFLLADKWGRRTSAITGGVILSGLMFLIGSLWGIVGKIYASEIQPDHTRAAATCIAQGLGFFTNWLVAILAPILLDASSFAAYFLFGGLALGTVIVLAAYMPETRGRTLEDIQEAFHRPALSNIITGLRQSFRIRERQVPTEGSTELEHRTTAASGIGDEPSAENVTISWRLDVA
ncbi:hypothetical protein GQX73_g3227 [Xylaria multiplex]|uniref:Major facilitator superfamily (MFS) profile domain-containing protein n=1 Tax=Xylaria multiplex TaxID=323545 RepID=A0A7C8IVX3_9PEZI|nr:hypothetical protein GQX73_g3227 [Xylaria multiplex]